MFKISDDLLEKIKTRITGEELCPAGPRIFYACSSCCYTTCDGSCDATCSGSDEGGSSGGSGW